MGAFSEQKNLLHFCFKVVILGALQVGFWKEPPISGAYLTD